MFRPKIIPKDQKQETIDLMAYSLDSGNRLTHAFFMDIFHSRSKWLFNDGGGSFYYEDYFIIIDGYGIAREIPDTDNGFRYLDSLLYDEFGRLRSRYARIRLRSV